MIGFGSIGGGEVLLILALALLLFGPRKIPQISRTIGKTLAEFRKATTDLKLNLEREVDMESIRKTGDEIKAARAELNSVARETAGMAEPSETREKNDATRPAGETGADRES
jgi:Tat protein translocase TatB subunit